MSQRPKPGPDGILQVRDAAQLHALSTVVRQEIIDAVRHLDSFSVSDVAREMGRPADSLYFHMRILERAGLIVAQGERVTDRRPETVYRSCAPGASIRLSYDSGDPRADKAALKAVRTLLKAAVQDFDAGRASSQAVMQGPERNLWAGRNVAWLSRQDLREVNKMLARLSEIFGQPRSPGRDRLCVLSYGLAPVETQPLRRRQAPRRKTRSQRPPKS